jgi:membrane-bound serine protease (ClpP class)
LSKDRLTPCEAADDAEEPVVAQPILLAEILLVGLGIIFLILEFKAPGHLISGVLAVACFAGFFWLHFDQEGPLIIVAVALFTIGLALLGIEIFLLPGFGATGVGGVLLMLAGLVLAGIERLPQDPGDWGDMMGLLLRHLLTMAGAGVAACVVARHLPDMPFARWLVLVPPEDKHEPEDLPLPGAEAAIALLGHVGVAASDLRPAGMARIGDRRVDVLTEWEYLDAGTPVQVVAVEGTRIVVKKV